MDYLTIALILFAIGVILLVAEVLLPTGGIFVIASLLFFALGVGIIFAQGSNLEVVVALGGLAIGLPVTGLIAVSAYRRFSIGSILSDDQADASNAGTGAADLEALKDHIGKTVSPMRPSGTVEIEGRRIDAMAEGVMLEAGVWVRCVSVKGGKVIVRQIESPADIANIDSNEPPSRNDPASHRDVFPPSGLGPERYPHESMRPFDDLDDLDLDLDK